MLNAQAFANLIDLAARAFGGSIVGTSDEFFAEADGLLEAEEPVFEAHRYTDRGKWMDGWESRRRRHGGYDFCVIELGAPGRVAAFDIDTRHFVGNHPPYARVDGLCTPRGTPLDALLAASWSPLLDDVSLAPGSHNLFTAEPSEPVTHVRLSIFPDGGVARFRVFGCVAGLSAPEHDEQSRVEVPPGLVDLAAVKSGGRALACSDSRFGGMQSLIMPGRARTMGEGWETRRARSPEHRSDWIVVALGARGTLAAVEVDTSHYKGNCPERCVLDGLDRPGLALHEVAAVTDYAPLLASTPLAPDTRHFFTRELLPHAPITHVRLSIFPDGGIGRLRLWGTPHA
jgi:allantoicase